MALAPLAIWCLVHLPAMAATFALRMSTLTLVLMEVDRLACGNAFQNSGPGFTL